jgi:hypothetical protein
MAKEMSETTNITGSAWRIRETMKENIRQTSG